MSSNENYYKEGCQFAIENAKGLSKIAKIAATEKEFGVACSLGILAGEESIKAIFLLLKHLSKEDEIEDFDKIFKYHKTKHQYLPEITILLETCIQLTTVEGIANYFSDMIYRLSKEIPEPQRQELLDKGKPFINFMESLKKEDQKKVDIKEAEEWWKKADLMKIRGFYVDQVNGLWHDPKTFTEDQYLEVEKFAFLTIRTSEKIINLLDTG